MRSMAVLAVLVMMGCATSRETYTSDGSKGYSIGCSGSMVSWGACYEKAGELCGSKGYDVLSGGSDQGVVATNIFASSTHNRSMIVRCK